MPSDWGRYGMRGTNPTNRRAFTLLELLVVIAIIATIFALLFPAVQRIRDAAARAKCTNNLRQLGLAAQHCHDNRGSFPPGMRFKPARGVHWLSSWLVELLPYVEQQPLKTA